MSGVGGKGIAMLISGESKGGKGEVPAKVGACGRFRSPLAVDGRGMGVVGRTLGWMLTRSCSLDRVVFRRAGCSGVGGVSVSSLGVFTGDACDLLVGSAGRGRLGGGAVKDLRGGAILFSSQSETTSESFLSLVNFFTVVSEPWRSAMIAVGSAFKHSCPNGMSVGLMSFNAAWMMIS